VSKPARSIVCIPGSGPLEQDAARTQTAERRRLIDFPIDLVAADERGWSDFPPTWLKLAGVAVLLCGAYLVGWSSAEPALGSAAPEPSRRGTAMRAEASVPPSTPPATTSARALSSEEFRELQGKLATLGHDPGPVDGLFGPQTVAAVKRYEIANGQEPTGHIDLHLLERLRSEP
jgi:hypothetical protein